MTRTRPVRFRIKLRLEALEARDVPSFLPPVGYSVPAQPNGPVVADFNGDGRRDVAIGISTSVTGNVGVYLGNGDGTLQPKTDYPVSTHPYDLAAVDMNLDGKLDLVTASSAAANVDVLLGNGNGTFTAAMSFPGAGDSMGTADFNGDGKQDVAVTNTSAQTVGILLGNGDGTLQPPMYYATGGYSVTIAVGDLNSDGWSDLAVGHSHIEDTISVLLNRMDGTFEPPAVYAAGQDPQVGMGDFNKDGRADVISANASDDSISVFLANGDGTLQPRVDYPTHEIPGDPVVADFNRDRKLDIATTSHANQGVAVLLGKGDGTFAPLVVLPLDDHQQFGAPAAGDLNNDRFPDLVVGGTKHQKTWVFTNDGVWAPPIPAPPGPGREAIAVRTVPTAPVQSDSRIHARVLLDAESVDALVEHTASITPVRRTPFVDLLNAAAPFAVLDDVFS